MSKAQRGRTRPKSAGARVPRGGAPGQASSAASSEPRRPTYPDAVATYERAMTAVQAHRFAEALEAFRTLSAQYPEEQELLERARVYEAVCERHLARPSAEPRSLDERVYAATLALNQGDVDTALGHLQAVVAADGNHDGALYMLGVGHALRNENRLALSYLRRAIACNPSNRVAALHDEQLASLLRDDTIRAALVSDPELSPGSR